MSKQNDSQATGPSAQNSQELGSTTTKKSTSMTVSEAASKTASKTTRKPARVNQVPATSKRRSASFVEADSNGLRRAPTRARGQATFERLLATAETLLENEGVEALTTNRIAADSQTNISSIYKYFSNKNAIITTLFERHDKHRANVAREVLQQLGVARDWRELIDKAVDEIALARRSLPGSSALRRAMRSSPELAALDQKSNAAIVVWFSEQLQRVTDLTPRRALLVARIMLEAELALFDWWETPEAHHDAEIVHEIKVLLKAYLNEYAKEDGIRG